MGPSGPSSMSALDPPVGWGPVRSTAASICAGVLLWVTIVAGQAAGAPKGDRPDPPAESPRYITVVVQRGDTLFQIARRYGVTVDVIVRANGLRDPDALRVGQILLIPLPAGTQAPSPNQRSAVPVPNGYLWPVQGPIMSGFGARDGRRHTGIDISAPAGTPIAAARDGVVTHAGVYYDYGITVMIDHGDGVSTVYGHVSILLVRTGQNVQAGDTIARVGCTGRCTGSHVHFELRVQGQAVDPMTVLREGRIAAQAPSPVRAASRPLATPPAPPTDRMELERITRGGVTIIRYVSLTPDAVVLTEDTLLSGQLVAREEDIITERDGRRVRIKRIYAVKNGTMTLLAEETVALDDEAEEQGD